PAVVRAPSDLRTARPIPLYDRQSASRRLLPIAMPIDLRAAITPDVLDLIQESVFLCDLDGRVQYWNRAAPKLYGWTADQALGRDAQRLLNTRYDHPADADAATLRTGDHWYGKVRRSTASGVELVVDVRRHLLRDGRGEPGAVLEAGRDVTMRTHDALTPQDRERRYLNLFDNPAAAFFELDFTDVGALVRELRKSGVADLSAHLRERPDVARTMMRLTRVIEVN